MKSTFSFTACLSLLVVSSVVYSQENDQKKPSMVEFGTSGSTIALVDKTPTEYRSFFPERKIVECKIRLSATFNTDESIVDRIEYRFTVPGDCKIVDYLPTTTIGSEVSSIDMRSSGSERRVNIVSREGGASAGFELAGVGANLSKKSSNSTVTDVSKASSVNIGVLPPKVIVTLASTQKEGRSLLLRLQQHGQSTVQGDKDYVLLVDMPKNCLHGTITVSCIAFFKPTTLSPVGRTREFLVRSGGLTKREFSEPKGWSSFAPIQLKSQEVARAVELDLDKTKALDGRWKYRTQEHFASFSGNAVIKDGKVRLLDGLAATLVPTLNGGQYACKFNEVENGLEMEHPNGKKLDAEIDKQGVITIRNGAETMTFTPDKLEDTAAFKTAFKLNR